MVLSPRGEREKHEKSTSREGGHGGLGESVARMRFQAELAAATAPKDKQPEVTTQASRDSTNVENIMGQAVMAHANKITPELLAKMGDRQRIMEQKLRGDLRGDKGKNAWLQLAKEQSERIEKKLQEEVKPLGDTVMGGNGGWLNSAMKGGGFDIFAELDDTKA